MVEFTVPYHDPSIFVNGETKVEYVCQIKWVGVNKYSKDIVAIVSSEKFDILFSEHPFKGKFHLSVVDDVEVWDKEYYRITVTVPAAKTMAQWSYDITPDSKHTSDEFMRKELLRVVNLNWNEDVRKHIIKEALIKEIGNIDDMVDEHEAYLQDLRSKRSLLIEVTDRMV